MAESQDEPGRRPTTSADESSEFDAPPLEHVPYFKRFLHHDMAGSGLLLLAALAAVVVANVGFHEQYRHLWHGPFGLSWGDGGSFQKSLHHWVNDGLMSIFFFLVGLEIKREIRVGELASFRQALLPAVAAVGGMIAPACVYALLNPSGEGAQGWGIPMATDIAFAAGCIALVKKRVPPALMIFLVALAIVDDLGAVAVIAVFYTDSIAFQPLLAGAALIVLSLVLGQLGVRRTWPFIVIGIVIWLAFLQSGVHATIAGVLLAFTIPEKARYRTHQFHGRMEELLGRFTQAEEHWEDHMHESDMKDLMVNARQQGLIRHMDTECHHVEAPLQRIEHGLEPICAFAIMPIFAFANAGVHIEFGQIGGMLLEPVTLGIIFGLCLGKPLGILIASFIAVKLGWASLPRGVDWKCLLGAGMLAGIGFTMSLFINELAFVGVDGAADMVAQGKVGILLASVVSAVAGLVWLSRQGREPTER